MRAIIFLMLILLVSCDINMKFDKKDKVWIDIYKANDLLVFKSVSKNDSILIPDIEIGNGDEDIVASSYNSAYATVNYKQLDDKNKKKQDYIISILKSYPQQPTSASFNFKEDFGSIRDINNYPVTKLKFRNEEREGYLFKPFSQDKPSFQWDEEYGVRNAKLKYFFWDKEYGIIQYETVVGEIFVLEKFIRDGKNRLEY